MLDMVFPQHDGSDGSCSLGAPRVVTHLDIRQINPNEFTPVLWIQTPERSRDLLVYHLHLSLDHERVSDGETVENLGELHKLLPAPVVLLLAKSVKRVAVLGLLRVLVDDRDRELREVTPSRKKLIVISDAKEQRQVVAHVASLRVDQNVPALTQSRDGAKTTSIIRSLSTSLARARHSRLVRSHRSASRSVLRTHHLYPPTSNTFERNSLLLISLKFSIFQVNFPYIFIG